MRFQHIFEAITSKPWMITPESHRAVRQLVERAMAGGVKAQEREGMFGPLPSMTVGPNGIARIPVVGVLGRGLSPIEKSCGACSYDDVQTDIIECRSDSRITGVILEIDSPGGAVNGLYELGDEIMTTAESKPVIAFTAGQMCSAAYYIACCCSGIAATSSATVGSVGVILQLLDDSKAYEMAGLKVETIKSDELKGTGAPGTPLSDKQREYLQGLVDECCDEFKGLVVRQRALSDESSLDGRVFTAETAARLGLIDRVVRSISEAEEMI